MFGAETTRRMRPGDTLPVLAFCYVLCSGKGDLPAEPRFYRHLHLLRRGVHSNHWDPGQEFRTRLRLRLHTHRAGLQSGRPLLELVRGLPSQQRAR